MDVHLIIIKIFLIQKSNFLKILIKILTDPIVLSFPLIYLQGNK